MTGRAWIVYQGLRGYLPEGEPTYATDPEQLADILRDELDTAAEYAHDGAEAHAEQGDYETAWNLLKACEAMDNLRANLDNGRKSAPLYVDNVPLWHETILRTVAENFPYDIPDSGAAIYVEEVDQSEIPQDCAGCTEGVSLVDGDWTDEAGDTCCGQTYPWCKACDDGESHPHWIEETPTETDPP